MRFLPVRAPSMNMRIGVRRKRVLPQELSAALSRGLNRGEGCQVPRDSLPCRLNTESLALIGRGADFGLTGCLSDHAGDGRPGMIGCGTGARMESSRLAMNWGLKASANLAGDGTAMRRNTFK